jgi:hypothetical protein
VRSSLVQALAWLAFTAVWVAVCVVAGGVDAWRLLSIGTGLLLFVLHGREVWRERHEPEPEPVAEVFIGDLVETNLTGRLTDTLRKQMDMPGGVRIVGAAMDDYEAHFCRAMPEGATVIGPGGFIAGSDDPTAHVGALAACYKPKGHRDLHTWQVARVHSEG